MKTLILIIAMTLFAGCAFVSVDDRMDLAVDCGIGDECQVLWDEYNEALERQELRAENRRSVCGSGMILYCDKWCTASRSNKNEGICVSRNSIAWLYY